MEYTIYIKPTNCCNLSCKHCYNTTSRNNITMTDVAIENVILFLKNFSADHIDDEINVQLHGGEPMLYDIDKLTHLVKSTEECKLRWSITTNLAYNINAAMLKFFKLMLPYDDKPYIMTSWDKDIRFEDDLQKLWKRNVKRLINKGIEVQPIVCVTRQLIATTSPEKLMDMMSNLGVTHMNFERITNTGNAADGSFTPTNRQTDDWLFEAYKQSKECGMFVPLFENIEDSVNGFLNGCRARQCMRTVITINPDCSVAACPNISNHTYGIIHDGILEYDQFKYNSLINREKQKNFNCVRCIHYKHCNSECCQLKYDDTGCPGLIKIYDYLQK